VTVVTNVLDRVLGPLSDSLSAQEVERLSTLPGDPTLEARMEALAEKANEGSLTVDERQEYELYIETSEFVAILLAKARARLRKAA
jgi:hypothetical protein